jgi:hypothetical protein
MRRGFIETRDTLPQARERRAYWRKLIADAYNARPNLACPFACGEVRPHRHTAHVGTIMLGEHANGVPVGSLGIFHAVKILKGELKRTHRRSCVHVPTCTTTPRMR